MLFFDSRIRWAESSDFGPKSDDLGHRILKSDFIPSDFAISDCIRRPILFFGLRSRNLKLGIGSRKNQPYEDLTWRDFSFFVAWLILRQLRFFGKFGPLSRPNKFGVKTTKKKSSYLRPLDGYIENTRAKNQGLSLKNVADIRTLAQKIYNLQFA